MRILIVDTMGSGVDLGMRAQRAGHDVKLFVRQTPDDKQKHIGRGLVPMVDDFKPWLRWSELVIATDNTLYLLDLERHRKEGGKVIAASQETAAWEINRQRGQEILRKAGIPVLPSKEFHDYDSAIAHVKKTQQRYVSKPTGDGTADKALSYCSSGPDDMIYMLERWKKLQKLRTPFILQEFVSGIEMGVAGWFGPGGWNAGWEENFEFKKLCNGDLGVATGEQGTVLRYTRNSKLANKMLKPVTGMLERAGYIGDIDVNCIIDEKGHAWPLEFTMRLGWPAFQLQLALVEGDPVQWLLDLANGLDARPFMFDRVAVGVVLSIPDYPYSHLTRREVVGIPIYGIKPSLWKHLHPCEMMLNESAPCKVNGTIVNMPMPATAGDYVLVMTATGETVKETALTAYRRLEKLKVPNSPMYRTDIGKRLAKQLPILQAKGYATGMEYSLQN